MGKIKNIVFDLGGVIIDLDRDEPVRRLIEIGVKDADGLIDPYEQKGVFQDLETGKIGGEQVGTRRSPGIDLEAEGAQIAEIHLLASFQTFQHALGGGDEHGRNVSLVHRAFTRYQGR